MRRVLRQLSKPVPAAVAGALVLLVAFDVVVTTPGWPYAVLLGVPAVAVAALVSADPRRADVLAVVAVVLSATGTAALAATEYLYIGTWGAAGSAALLLLLVVRWRVAVRRRDWVVVAAVAVAVVGQALSLPMPDALVFVALLVAAEAVAASIGVALRSADAKHRMTVAAVRRAEREEIARELHDVVAHHVTGIVVLAQAGRAVPEQTPAGAQAPSPGVLASIEAAGTEALASMRRMVGVLRTDELAVAQRLPTPRLGDLEALVRRFRANGAARKVELTVEVGGAEIAVEVQAGIYRVVQEALTNVQRHAPGTAGVHVLVSRGGDEVVTRVLNTSGPGGPAPVAAGGGFGVLGMHERVTALGGALVVGPREGGWVVEARIPVTPTTDRPGGGR